MFEAITALPEYYLTRTEHAIFAEYGDEILAAASGDGKLAIIELGAGTAAKTGLLLAAAVRRQERVSYYPIDISVSALEAGRTRIGEEMPQVVVRPIVADYTTELDEIPTPGGRRLVLYIGSSIGNFEPAEAAALLRRLRTQLAPGDLLLLGVDHIKNRNTLLPAYNDVAGVTAEFNRNILTRIRRELGATFPPASLPAPRPLERSRIAHRNAPRKPDPAGNFDPRSGPHGHLPPRGNHTYRKQLQIHAGLGRKSSSPAPDLRSSAPGPTPRTGSASIWRKRLPGNDSFPGVASRIIYQSESLSRSEPCNLR